MIITVWASKNHTGRLIAPAINLFHQLEINATEYSRIFFWPPKSINYLEATFRSVRFYFWDEVFLRKNLLLKIQDLTKFR